MRSVLIFHLNSLRRGWKKKDKLLKNGTQLPTQEQNAEKNVQNNVKSGSVMSPKMIDINKTKLQLSYKYYNNRAFSDILITTSPGCPSKVGGDHIRRKTNENPITGSDDKISLSPAITGGIDIPQG